MVKDTAIVTMEGERRIGNRTQSFEWYQFEWPSVTFARSRLFDVKVVQHEHTAILTMTDK